MPVFRVTFLLEIMIDPSPSTIPAIYAFSVSLVRPNAINLWKGQKFGEVGLVGLHKIRGPEIGDDPGAEGAKR